MSDIMLFMPEERRVPETPPQLTVSGWLPLAGIPQQRGKGTDLGHPTMRGKHPPPRFHVMQLGLHDATPTVCVLGIGAAAAPTPTTTRRRVRETHT